jgi:hypothetical protein
MILFAGEALKFPNVHSGIMQALRVTGTDIEPLALVEFDATAAIACICGVSLVGLIAKIFDRPK